jgi:hypothetical protein
MSDDELWNLLCNGGPADFDHFSKGIGKRLHDMRSIMMRTAHKRAPDLDAEEVVSETVKVVLTRAFDQFVNKDGDFVFDPRLAPFEGYVSANMGGTIRKGVVDTLRQQKRRRDERFESRGEIESDAVGFVEIEADASDPPDVQQLLSPLTCRENLVLRLEFRIAEHDGPDFKWVREAMIAAGYDPSSIAGMIKRAVEAGVCGAKIKQRDVSLLLGVSARSVRNTKMRALKKLKAKLFDQPAGGQRRAS